MTYETIVAVFDIRAHADAAVKALKETRTTSQPTIRPWSIFALLSTVILAVPLSAQAAQGVGKSCQQPITGTNVSTIYRFRTVPQVSNVNRYRNVTRNSYRDITRTRYRDINKVSYRDITRTRYVRHINRIVTITRVQPIVRVHMVTRVHHIVLTRVHTQVIPRVHVAVIPRVHTRTVVLNQNQYVAETRILPTRYAMAGSRTVSVGTRMAGLYAYAGSPKVLNHVKPRSKQRY